MGIIYDYCEGCEEICGSPRCFNCPYFSDSYLMYDPYARGRIRSRTTAG